MTVRPQIASPALAGNNRIFDLVALGPAAHPRAQVQNPLVAQALSFRPLPGAQPARQKVLNVLSDPGPRDDLVINALQRYFKAEPRRQPSADPRDEGSVVRHPQGLLQSNGRWAQDHFYQFADNGAANYQVRPEYRAWGGRLNLEITGAGQTTVYAPATRSPSTSAANFKSSNEPATAAQEAQMKEIMPPPLPTSRRPSSQPATWDIMPQPLSAAAAPKLPISPIKPPNMVDNPYFDPVFTAQNAIRKIQADLAPGSSPWLPIGPPNLSDAAYFDPSFTARNAIQFLQAALPGGGRNPVIQDSLARAQQIRDNFFRSGPAISSWS